MLVTKKKKKILLLLQGPFPMRAGSVHVPQDYVFLLRMNVGF